ncbi:TraB/GumN family protein [Streptomyces griseofuscus]|uniref:TraB/GumN family protein n=1 Tax=Streptomyces griseofuscus TaxID=146922 RepID=UPI0011A04198|nr:MULTISPECIES: TraB/GumN family protein [Streptomyces]
MRHGFKRARRKRLHREIDAFSAVLRSSRPGIYYTATIQGALAPEPSGSYDPDEIADRVRTALRTTAAAAVRDQDPIDLPAAQDACARQLRQPQELGLPDGATVTASVQLELADEDRAAVKELLTAIRAQAATDTLTRQRAEALAQELAHPAALLARWLQQPDAQITQPPADAELEALARRLRGYPKDHDEPMERQLLTILRDFLAEFPKEEQKRLLVILLANGMRAARKPGHADQVEALLTPPPATSETRPTATDAS